MILLDDKFMKEELDYAPMVENPEILYKDYYFKICAYISKVNVYSPMPSDIDNYIHNGVSKRLNSCRCNVELSEREYLFKRAMGLQLIYDTNIGRNTMAKGTNKEEDICRETIDLLETLGLLQTYGW